MNVITTCSVSPGGGDSKTGKSGFKGLRQNKNKRSSIIFLVLKKKTVVQPNINFNKNYCKNIIHQIIGYMHQ